MTEWLLFFVVVLLCFISRQLSVICGAIRYQTNIIEGDTEGDDGGPGEPVLKPKGEPVSVPKIKLVA